MGLGGRKLIHTLVEVETWWIILTQILASRCQNLLGSGRSVLIFGEPEDWATYMLAVDSQIPLD